MKLARFGAPREERPGVLLDEKLVDCSGFCTDWDERFFAGEGLEELARWLSLPGNRARVVPEGTRLGPPISRPSKIVCVGLNFAEHAAETRAKMPGEPVLFLKATSALAGPHDELVIPRGGSKVDWEVELGVVIGRTARYVAERDALEHVAGYVLHVDYSERAFQKERGGQWTKGKSCDTFAPLGPFLATRAEVRDPQALAMRLAVNGVVKQSGHTAEMIFPVAALVSYVSQFMTLLPGDLISTGTPAGVGLGFDPPQFLSPGDVVESSIEGLGTQRQVVVPPR